MDNYTSNQKRINNLDSCFAETSIFYMHSNLNKDNTQNYFTKSFLSSLILVFALLFTSAASMATTITSTITGGDWATGSTWSGGTAPSSSDSVVIASGAAITLSTNASCNSLTFAAGSAGASLTINSTNALSVAGSVTINGTTTTLGGTIAKTTLDIGAGSLSCASLAMVIVAANDFSANRATTVLISTGVLTVTGNITVNIAITGQTGITFSDAGTVNVGGSFMLNPVGAFTPDSGTVNYNGSSQTISDYNYYNLTLSGSGTKTLVANTTTTIANVLNIVAPTTMNVNGSTSSSGSLTGDGILNNTGTADIHTTGSNNTSTSFTGTISNSGSALGLTKVGTGVLTLTGVNTYTGATRISAGVLSVATIGNGGIAGNLGKALTAAANLVLDGGTLQYTGATSSTNRRFTLTRGKTSTIDINSNTLDIIGIVSEAGTGNAALTKTGSGILQLSGTNTYTGLTTINAGTLRVGNIAAFGSAAGGVVITSPGQIDLFGISPTAEALSITGAGPDDNGALVNTSATEASYNGAITLTGATTIGGDATAAHNITLTNTVTGAFTLTKMGNAILNLGTSTVTIGGLTISEGAVTATTGTLFVSGGFSNNGAFTHNNGTVNLNGGTQTIGGSVASTFNNLIISGSLTKTLTKSVTVNGNLTLTSGFVATDATNILTIAAGGTTSGVSSSSFVNGPMVKAGNTAFDFPVGAGTKLGRIGISGLSGTASFTAQYFNASPSNRTALGTGLNGGTGKISSVEYWNLTPASSVTANVILHWEDNTSGVTSSSPTDLVVAHYTASNWISEGNAGTTSSGAAGTLASNAISTWSPFTFGSPSGVAPLPVKLISFTAKAIEKDAILNWSTATEKNNDHFEIERSNDGVNFTKAGDVSGAGNSTSIIKYAFTDARVADFSTQHVYYRLKQVDFDGSFEYSNLAIVTFVKQGVVSILNVQPNPFAGNLVVNYNLPNEGNVTILIIDAQGRIVASNELIANKGANKATFNTAAYAKGIYFISVNYNGSSTNYKMLVKE